MKCSRYTSKGGIPNETKKTLFALLLSTVLILGASITVFANSGSTLVNNNTIAYGSSVTESTGTAFTTMAGGLNSATVSVSSTYHYHQNVTYENYTSAPKSASGAKNAVVDFSCGSSYSTSYIYSTHNATVGDVTMEQRTTSASN